MRGNALLAVMLSIVAIIPGRAEDPRPSAATASALIEQLGSRDYHIRDSASKRLQLCGIEVLPALQKARGNPDPEVRRRLEELIAPLERAVTLMPKRITLHAKNKTIRDVLAEFGKQTGYKLATWPDAAMNGEREKTVYSFDFDNLTFWEALDKLCESSGLVLQQNYGEDNLRLFYQDSYVPFVCYDGPFRVVATGFNYGRSNNFGQLPRNPSSPIQQSYESLQVNLMVAAEPKLPILRLGTVKIISARDEEGQSMVPVATSDPNDWGGMRHYYGGYYRNYIQPTQASLIWPSKTSKTVKRLTGVIPVTLLADQKPTLVTDNILSAKAKKFKAGAASFHVEAVDKIAGNQYQVKLVVTEQNNDGANDYSQIQSVQQRLEVQDAKGNKLPFYCNIASWPSPASAQLTLVVQTPPPTAGPPHKLIYYTWVLMEHELAFEFRDLPLP